MSWYWSLDQEKDLWVFRAKAGFGSIRKMPLASCQQVE